MVRGDEQILSKRFFGVLIFKVFIGTLIFRYKKIKTAINYYLDTRN